MKKTSFKNRLPVLYAGSLTMAFNAINKEFKRRYPDIEIVEERGGSASLARAVAAGKECGVLASADYILIPELMFHDSADWYIIFASNQMVLRYTKNSRYQEQIDSNNWCEILQRDGVMFWHSDPAEDPSGYRALMVLQLAEKYYRLPGLYERLVNSEHDRLMTMSTFQESGSGYMFGYGVNTGRSEGKFLVLPNEINLSDIKFESFYQQAAININGNSPGEIVTLHGNRILFGITIPKGFSNQDMAIEWIHLLFSAAGEKSLEQSGMVPIIPAIAGNPAKMPEELRKYIK